MKIIALIALGLISLTGCGGYSEWNHWIRDCNNAGGVVSIAERGFWADRYECYVDGEMVTLPGWEGY